MSSFKETEDYKDDDDVDMQAKGTDSDDDDDDEENFEFSRPAKAPPKSLLGRRKTVMSAPPPVDENWVAPHFEKNAYERKSIRSSVVSNLLFKNLSDDEMNTVLSAMKPCSFEKDVEVIREGNVTDDGDLFYVLEEGICDVFVKGKGKVMTIEGGTAQNYFGELALLYDAPRAATVRTVVPTTAWALDRLTFKRILMASTMKQRNKYKSFLEGVPLLKDLSLYERLTLADALTPLSYTQGESIIKEGDEGNLFFIVEHGEVKCTKWRKEGEVSRRLQPGDYFGEVALLHDSYRAATVTAVRDTVCLLLDRVTFKRLLGPLENILIENEDMYQLQMDAKEVRK